MNKQELIEKLNQEIKELKSTEASCFKLGSKTEELKFTNRIMGLQLALNWARRLNEPQKVKVPALVAEYIVWCHSEGLTLWEVFKTIRGMPEKVWEWLKDEGHQAVFSKAYTDGYEVEEEPRWTVKVKGHYLMHLEYPFDDMTLSDVVSFTTDSKEEADAVAFLAKGTVEKV